MKKILLAIICIFLITRLYKIEQIPPSVYWDEASIGYNAYSISQTGRDEWGKFLPIHFRAFGEFKLPVYIYSVVPFVKLFGLNEITVRFPAVLFSLGVVLLTFLLAKRLSGNDKVALLSAFFLSISPWFFIFSRTGYEATAGLAFYLAGIYLFLFNKKSWYIFFSIVSFILSAYSYNSFRIIIPLTILILVILELNNLKKAKIVPIILSLVILILSIIPIYRLYKYDNGVSRLQVVAATNSTFFKNYISHFNPGFLFLSGDINLRSQQGGFGQLYLTDLFLLPLGLIYMINRKSKINYLTIFILLISPIPAAITKESPHALRSIAIVPFLSMISAYGVVFIRKYFNKSFVEILIVLISIFFFVNYSINFNTAYPTKSSADWQYGYKMIYSKFGNEFSKYDRVIISDEYAQPYIFALFYLKYDPNKFQKNVVRNSVDQWSFSTVSSFDKFEFGKINKLVTKDTKNSLIFASQKEKLMDVNPFDTIKFLNGETAFWIYKI